MIFWEINGGCFFVVISQKCCYLRESFCRHDEFKTSVILYRLISHSKSVSVKGNKSKSTVFDLKKLALKNRLKVCNSHGKLCLIYHILKNRLRDSYLVFFLFLRKCRIFLCWCCRDIECGNSSWDRYLKIFRNLYQDLFRRHFPYHFSKKSCIKYKFSQIVALYWYNSFYTYLKVIAGKLQHWVFKLEFYSLKRFKCSTFWHCFWNICYCSAKWSIITQNFHSNFLSKKLHLSDFCFFNIWISQIYIFCSDNI